MKNITILFTLSFLAVLALPFQAKGQGFTVPLCSPTLQITQGPSHIICTPATACTWSWVGPGLNFSCTNCQVPTITAPATGIYTATVYFNGQSNGSITYSISFGYVDADGDLFNRCEDCNDNSALERPGQLWYRDLDGDGYTPSLTTFVIQCQRPAGYKATLELAGTASDCNDNNATVRPGGTEVCDGLDNNCASGIDEGVTITYYRDQDGDGFGNPAITQTGCSQPGGYVTNNTDCVDNSAVQRPGQTWYKDTDNDGYGAQGVASIMQCLRPAGYKAASELPGGTANDCNDNSSLERPGQQWYRDNDGDGYAQTGSAVTQCSRPAGYKHASELTSTTGDCNDNDAAIRPGVTDILCNNIDEDCSGSPAADNTPPSAVCKNITVTLVNNSATITASQLDNGSSDNCGSVTFSANPTTFNCSQLGQNVSVVLTVTDGNNNTANCTAIVTITGVCAENCAANGTVLFVNSPTPGQTATVAGWSAPEGGPKKVRITAKGAKGGSGVNGSGGPGAVVAGDFIIGSGQTLHTIAGAAGEDGNYSGVGGVYGGSGGGGSGVLLLSNGTPLIIAGGGGGGGFTNAGEAGHINPGNGNGGTGNSNGSGGGGGFFTDGGGIHGGKKGFNGAGGIALNDPHPQRSGGTGFGGGGGCSIAGAGGGGGGFTGGNGTSANVNGGGGGSSCNLGSNQNNTTGANNTWGEINIQCLGTAALSATVTPTQPVCGPNPTQGSVAIDLTGDLNGMTTGVEYAIVSGSTFTGTPAFTGVTADPLNLASGMGTLAGIYTVRIRLTYNPDLYVDRTYTLTARNTGTIYVNQAATGANNGTSWEDAYTDLQTALTATCPGSHIYVAQGTYKPASGTDRTMSFSMKENVVIYGGFPNTGNPGFNDRNYSTYVTTLSGDIGIPGNNSDNSYHVVRSNVAGASLDGFVISDGNANHSNVIADEVGGGMYNLNSNISIRNCIFQYNNSIFAGGGLYNEGGTPNVYNCVFRNNHCHQPAGALYNQASFPSITNCSFFGNTSNGPLSTIANASSEVSIVNCIIRGAGNVLFSTGSISVSYSIVQGGHIGTGNLDVDPLFVNAAAGDLRLQGCSPAINAGHPDYSPSNIKDLANNPRYFNNGRVDMGAYEYQDVRTPAAAVCRNITVQLGVDNTVSVTGAQLNNGSTGCGNLSYLIDGQTSLSFDCDDLDTPQNVTLTVTDGYNSTAACSAIITVADDINPCCAAPQAVCKPYTAVLNGNSVSITPADVDNGSTAECGLQSITVSPNTFNCSNVGPNTVTLTLTDIRGESSSCQAVVTVVDNTAPTIACPATQTVVLGANCTATLPDYTTMATTGDNCGVQSVTQSPIAGATVSGSGNITVTLTVTDVNNLTNSCTFTVTKVDNTAPTITCPATQTLVLGANCNASLPDYTNLATTSDNCGVQSVTQSPVAGTAVSGTGNIMVTLTVTDVNNLTNTCTFTVTKVDNTAPTITCPATQTLVLGANCGATLPNYISLATTGDNCGVQSVTQSPVAGTAVSGTGNIMVMLTVTDVNNLTNSCTFTVTKVDNTAPTITCPATQTLVLGANCNASLPDYTNLATTGDNCGVQSVTQSPVAGTAVSGTGNIMVTLTVTDVNNLTNTCTFTVTKVDNTAPTITCPATQTLVLGANCGATLPNYISLATTGDNCGVQSVTQSPVAGTAVSGTGNIMVTLTVTDVNNLTNTCMFTVTKVDNTPPAVTTGAIASCYPTAVAAEAAAIAATGATDNCLGGITKTAGTGGSCSAVITVTVRDASNNSATATYSTRIDNTPPTLVGKSKTVLLGNTGTYTLQAADVFDAQASSDNCPGALTVTNISPATVNCSQLNQVITITVTVQDGCGNSATCVAYIMVEEGSVLPVGWSSANVGNANGSAGYKACSLSGSFTVAASGFSTSSADVLHFASRQLCGNSEIIARIENVTGGGWAGVMLRESLAPGSKKVTLKTQLTPTIRREVRAVTNGAVSLLNITRPSHIWLRLVRSGSNFVGYTATDGINWNFAFSTTLDMVGCMYVGVFAESINGTTTTSATFNNVGIVGSSSSLVEHSAGVPEALDGLTPAPEVQVFPNPANGEITLRFGELIAEKANIRVVNAFGESLMMKEMDAAEASELRMDLSAFPDGVYFVQVQLPGYAPTTKRIVLAKAGAMRP